MTGGAAVLRTDEERRLMLALGSRLRSVRYQRGRSGADVARELGVDKSTYATWETGTRAIPAFRLILLARVLNVPLSVLLSGM